MRNIEVQALNDGDWKNLLKQIKKGTCVPFLGPEVRPSVYPSKAQIAQKWAAEEGYPLEDVSDLARVSQFLAVQQYQSYPVEKLIEEYEGIQPPTFDDPKDIHRVLAELPLPLYITTNYDHSMTSALKSITIPRDARTDFCRWRNAPGRSPLFEDYSPTASNPLVFHLFGRTEEETSLVLTEHDYLKFLVNVSQESSRIPTFIRGSITEGLLLFLGYRFNDWDFRVLIHAIANYLALGLSKAHVSVVTPEEQREASIYLRLYFRSLDLKVYLGTSRDFMAELRQRWEDYIGG